MRRIGWSAVVVLLAVMRVAVTCAATEPVSPAANLSGLWQGSVNVGALPMRFVIRLEKDSHGVMQAALYNIGQSRAPIPVSAVTQTGSTLKLLVPRMGNNTYEGTLSADGASIEGRWTSPDEPEPLPMRLQRATAQSSWLRDLSPHKVLRVSVDHGVRLEVLDWGGKGRPLVLLTGLGNDAHVYDTFAPKLTAAYHVVAITRRGFGASSAPATGYSADRLADDVLEVFHALGLVRPLVAGHSIGGEELSSIALRHPDQVAGLIYLDAGYAYAFYNEAASDGNLRLQVDANELRRKLEALGKGDTAAAQQLRTIELPRFAQDLEAAQSAPPPPPMEPPEQAIRAGMQRFAPTATVPVLAIYADPHDDGGASEPNVETQVAFVEHALPNAHVVRLAHANHYVFLSNEAEVLAAINAFAAGLPPH